MDAPQSEDRVFLERFCLSPEIPLMVDTAIEQRLVDGGYLVRQGSALRFTARAAALFKTDVRPLMTARQAHEPLNRAA